MRFSTVVFLVWAMVSGAFAEDIIAVFPPHGVNTDQSFIDAFGMLLASKYRHYSGLDVLPPTKTRRAIPEDSNFVDAARELGAREYIETEAVGLYLSRREKAEVEYGGINGEKGTIIVKIDNTSDDDDDDDDDDEGQELLDNHKTVVTVTRRDASGNRIHMVEMTLVTYGDIEESTERIAEALFKKLSADEVMGLNNVTRRDGLGHNKLFVDNLKGVKIGYIYPFAAGKENIEHIITIGYNHRMDSEKFFLEFGAGGRIPTKFDRMEDRYYGGAYMHMGGSYYFIREIIGFHGGIGVSPHFVMFGGNGIQLGLVPFMQVGVSFPRNSKIQGLLNVKVGQNVIELTTGYDPEDDIWVDPDDVYRRAPEKSYPTEFGIEMGLGF